MKLTIDIPEDVYTRLFDNGIQDNEIATDDTCEMARALRLGSPISDNAEDRHTISSLFEGMTNGEVIQALFLNGKVIERDEATGYEQMLDDKYSYCSWFDGLWWNAPYKAERSDKE